MNVHLMKITQQIGLLIQWRMSTSHWRSWEAHGRYNDPFVSKPNAFLDVFQSLRVAESLQQEHALTVDEALYLKLMISGSIQGCIDAQPRWAA